VVLIEAGPDYPVPADRPAEILDGHQPAFTHGWGYSSEPGTALEDAVLAATYGYFHPSGTCRMGPPGDALAVVDNQCRVHGIAGLIVVEASIMPAIPAANTNLPTLVVAARAAEWLVNAGLESGLATSLLTRG
jgi:choline dehydrogenase-like flavoprotein